VPKQSNSPINFTSLYNHFCPLDSTGPGSVSAASIIDAISAGYAPAGRDDIIDALARDGANSTSATDPDNPEYVISLILWPHMCALFFFVLTFLLT
jgi:hypothetical protein